jgi:hypothetical protein
LFEVSKISIMQLNDNKIELSSKMQVIMYPMILTHYQFHMYIIYVLTHVYFYIQGQIIILVLNL